MFLNFKAAALSAFVIPGLGQLLKGEKLKGAMLIVFVNIFLCVALFIILQEISHLIAIKSVGATNPDAILESIKTRSPYARWLLASFFVVWAYGVVDAIRPSRPEAGNLPEK
jgi:TM2 domain-containing membrane protein YozV